MDLVGTNAWNAYKALMDDAHDTFNQDIIIWRRYHSGLDYDGRDNEQDTFDEIVLKVLMDFNQYHKWPINETTLSGELERMNVFCYVNRKYLQSLNRLTPEGNFDYGNRLRDRFIYQGIIYKSFGETELSQAPDTPVHVALILQRQETMTGDTAENRNNGIQS